MKKSERMKLSSDLLRAFVAIAEHGHLTLAAESLNRTQSALSVQLRKLEATLDASLFERHAKGMRLTPDGEKLLPLAQRIMGDLYHAQSLFEQPLRGKIRVGIPDHYDGTVFEKVLIKFGKDYPHLDIFVKSGCSSGFPAAIADGRLDIAVVASSEPGQGKLLETELSHWAESETFECDPDTPVPLAVLDRGCWWSKLPANLLSQEQRAFNVTFKSESFSNLRCAIRAGLAIGILPARAIQSGMRVSPARRNLPALPAMSRSLLVGPASPPEITIAIAAALKDGLASG